MSRVNEFTQAGRSLLRKPGFSAIAVLTLALGIGANVAVFSVVNAVLLRPLPFPEAERIVEVMHHAPAIGLDELNNSPGTLEFYRQNADFFSAIGAQDRGWQNLTGGEEPERVTVGRMTPDFLEVLQVFPVMGRPFSEADAEEGAPAVALLTWESWTGRFGSDPRILDQTIYLNGEATQVVGVLPRGFDPEGEVVLYRPLPIPDPPEFGSFGMNGLARLAPGVTPEAAQQRIRDLQSRVGDFAHDVTPEFLEGIGWDVTLVPLRERILGDVETALWIVLGTVGFLFLIACANVANLFLVRAEGRQREMAIRAALGASRGRVAGTFLAESLILGLAGGVVGVLLAQGFVEGILALNPVELPRQQDIALGGASLGLAFALSLGAALLLGLLPLARTMGRSFSATLRDGGRGSTAGRSRHRTRNLLVAGQLALAVVLLVGSGLMVRSFAALRAVESGFEAENVVTMSLSLGTVEGPEERAAAVQFYRDLVDRVEGLPGVAMAAVSNSLPLESGNLNGSNFQLESNPTSDEEIPDVTMFLGFSPGYMEALGIPLLAGRPPEWSDVQGEMPAVWVNREFVDRFLDGGSAVGERIRFGEGSDWAEVVGVVGNVRVTGLEDDLLPMTYMPMQVGNWSRPDMSQAFLVVQGTSDATGLIPSIRATIRDLNPTIPISQPRTMDEIEADSMAETSFTLTILGIAAAMALMLGAIGLYGVISYAVTQRTQEIGVRMAMGADQRSVEGMVLRQSFFVAAGGVALGLVIAFMLVRVMEAVVYGVSTRDPATFLAVPVVLILVSVTSAWLPARRAARVDPVQALRAD